MVRANKNMERRRQRLNLMLNGQRWRKAQALVWKDEVPRRDWPLHVPKVSICDIDLMAHDALGTVFATDIQYALRFLHDADFHTAATCDPTKAPISRLRTRHIHEMVENGIAEFTPADQIKGWVVASLIPETRKKRFRLIEDAIVSNCARPLSAAITFRNITELLGDVATMYQTYHGTCTWTAVSYDMRSWYHQLQLSPAVSNFYGIRLPHDKWIAMRRGPMGEKEMVRIGHSITRFLAATASQGKICGFDVIIDNILFFGPDADAAAAVFENLCERYNITIGSKDHVTAEQNLYIDHRGMEFNFHTGTVRLRRSFVEKVRHRINSAAGESCWMRGVCEVRSRRCRPFLSLATLRCQSGSENNGENFGTLPPATC
jgi:hypothetical protein